MSEPNCSPFSVEPVSMYDTPFSLDKVDDYYAELINCPQHAEHVKSLILNEITPSPVVIGMSSFRSHHDPISPIAIGRLANALSPDRMPIVIDTDHIDF